MAPPDRSTMPTSEDEIMTPAELRVIREWLGLTGEALGQLVGVQDRTIRRWESGQDRIPDGARLDIEHLESLATEAVEALTSQLRDAAEISTLTYRTNEDFWAHRPALAQYPASWHRAIIARVAHEVPGLEIGYAQSST
jgi:transcriptional regulator with XRE-family HTH domain